MPPKDDNPQPDDPPPRRLTRRRLLKRAGLAGLAAAALGAGDALLIEPYWLDVSRPVAPIANLPPAWQGARIAQLTDLHVGQMSLEFIRQAVQAANRADPDIVALTGDFVFHTTPDGRYAETLRALRSREGVYAVLGNHDHWEGPEAIREMLASAGVTDLTNSHRVLRRDGQELVLAGVDDLWEGPPDLAAALADAPADAPRILLCHNPDYAEHMPAAPRVDLMLSGHTHGGQIRLPGIGALRLPIRHRQYQAGMVTGPHCKVYTSRGIGMISPPVRFLCRPELPVLTLRGA